MHALPHATYEFMLMLVGSLGLVTAQAAGHSGWQRLWRQSFSRRRSRNKGVAAAGVQSLFQLLVCVVWSCSVACG